MRSLWSPSDREKKYFEIILLTILFNQKAGNLSSVRIRNDFAGPKWFCGSKLALRVHAMFGDRLTGQTRFTGPTWVLGFELVLRIRNCFAGPKELPITPLHMIAKYHTHVMLIHGSSNAICYRFSSAVFLHKVWPQGARVRPVDGVNIDVDGSNAILGMGDHETNVERKK